MKKYLYLFIILFFPFLSLFAGGVASYSHPEKNENVVFFLTTPKSGANLITGCLCALTRKPISWFSWADTILDPSSPHRNHISYNRLGIPLESDTPLVYRTHYQLKELMRVPSEINKLIFVTRNPKELLYRQYSLKAIHAENPSRKFIKIFLDGYLQAFEVYDAWCKDTRMLVFYEEFIAYDEEILLQILTFIEENPMYLEDFLNNKNEYLEKLLTSYSKQHTHNLGGQSSKSGPQPIYYTKNASLETLKEIDAYIKNRAPLIWEKYLKQFAVKEGESLNTEK
jgi:hypothetical protein